MSIRNRAGEWEPLLLGIEPESCGVCGKGLYRNITMLRGGWSRCSICENFVHYSCLASGKVSYLKRRPRVCQTCDTLQAASPSGKTVSSVPSGITSWTILSSLSRDPRDQTNFLPYFSTLCYRLCSVPLAGFIWRVTCWLVSTLGLGPAGCLSWQLGHSFLCTNLSLKAKHLNSDQANSYPKRNGSSIPPWSHLSVV